MGAWITNRRSLCDGIRKAGRVDRNEISSRDNRPQGNSIRLASDKIIKAITIASLSILAVLLSYTFLLPLIFNQLLGLGPTIRLLATVVILTPLGFLMGFPFPLGIRWLKEMKMEKHIPWMWGINGVSSVLGSAMTIGIAISFGFTEALLVGTGCYFIIFLVLKKRSIKEV